MAALFAIGLLAGCATTRQIRGAAKPSGFLHDYSQLQEGEKGDTKLIYVREDIEWSQYDSILIDTVTIWFSEDANQLPVDEQQKITDLAYHAMHGELAKSFNMVEQPGPGVLRLRVAVSEAQGARVVGKAVTSIVPQLRLLTTVGGVATNTQVFVGKVGMEAEMLDSMTDERVGAAVDERSGTKAIRAIGGKWKDVRLAFEAWGGRLRERLVNLGVRTTASS
jgi:hypothetical protein